MNEPLLTTSSPLLTDSWLILLEDGLYPVSVFLVEFGVVVAGGLITNPAASAAW